MPEVIEADANGLPVPQGQEDKGKPEQVITISKAELEGLRRERDESRESEKYWATLARGSGSGKQPEPAGEPEGEDASEFFDEELPAGGPADDTPEKLVDDFAAQGVAALKSRGFITAAEAQKLAADTALKVSRELINRERAKMGTDQQIMGEFPELKDQTSELFKATAKIYQAAVAMDPNAKKTPAALMLAAKLAKAEISARGRGRGEVDEQEADRRDRVRAQDGRFQGRGETADDDMLGSEAREVIRSFGITDDQFRAARKETAGGRRETRR